MCIAIPLGQREGKSGTRLGRWLRASPTRLTSLAALASLMAGLIVLMRADQGTVAIPLTLALASLAESGLPRDLGVAVLGLPLVLIGGLFLASRTELA